jgi:glyoxylase-like metal-dependent hydrolase (beta-lactamase superfamily II)
MAHVIGDAVFVGDTLFMPDGGSARADFPGGDARVLYQSIQKIFTLPDDTRMFICHDYMPGGRDVKWETTVGEQKRDNIHVGKGNSEEDFVAMREARDATLGMPTLIMPSIQVNMRAGHMPQAEDNGSTYLKVPVSGIRDSGNNS